MTVPTVHGYKFKAYGKIYAQRIELFLIFRVKRLKAKIELDRGLWTRIWARTHSALIQLGLDTWDWNTAQIVPITTVLTQLFPLYSIVIRGPIYDGHFRWGKMLLIPVLYGRGAAWILCHVVHTVDQMHHSVLQWRCCFWLTLAMGMQSWKYCFGSRLLMAAD